ncbi:MAG: hypothetical protein KGI29_06730 [Pseudomonadota bacterium]|nr:hypothetical protein [Pseudomonadota bacterium]MDE3037565.1 hypothetical protein [Pseudomonadota bacterium]
MGINYAAADLLHRFTVNEAAMLWCDVGKITEEHISQFMIMKSAIVEAVKANKLKAAETPHKIVERRMNGGLYDMQEPDYEKAVITRQALKKWAERNNQKPRFLFPEMRGVASVAGEGAMITQYNIMADHVVVTPKPKQPKAHNVSSKPVTTSRENEMHVLIERIYYALRNELKEEPSSKQVYRTLETRHAEFDKDDIIQEVNATEILWISSQGNEQKMKLSTLINIVSKIRSSQK